MGMAQLDGCLLDGNRRVECVGRPTELRQKTVAQTLDHDPACTTYRPAHEPIVLPSEILGGVLPDPRPQLRRADQIGYHDRRELGSHRTLL
ncbi:MAG: hypothetical protein NVSMB4_02380 [Acidimicrobiales bacterium]